MQPKFILVGNTKDDLALNAVAFLENLGGFTIGLASQWESKKAFCMRIGISERTFDRKMRRNKGRHVPTVKIERGPGGKIVQLRSNPEFESYMQRKR